MGKVATVMKIFAKEGVSPEALLPKIKAVAGCNDARVEEYVFGAKIIRAAFVCEDSEGKDYEEIVQKVDGVENVQVDDVTLV
ncbi:MAG: hypothetical protein WC792_06245 [Candidatus Micrarchaeia archaeon]|jgi:translation elongation factor EF-1beta